MSREAAAASRGTLSIRWRWPLPRACSISRLALELHRGESIAILMVANTAAFTKAIGTFIRMEPAQRFWIHRRWRGLPLLPAHQSEEARS